jgi:hypothetical protein
METLDATIITTALPAMAKALGRTTLDLTASITVYLVAMTALVPAAGWASERFGARDVFAAAGSHFHRRLGAVRHQPDVRDADRVAALAGCGCRVHVAGRPTDRAARIAEARDHRRDRLDRLARPHRAGDWTAARWIHHDVRIMALDFPAQPAAGDHRRLVDPPLHSVSRRIP